jgi:membrane associated rhomboid family serine protease
MTGLYNKIKQGGILYWLIAINVVVWLSIICLEHLSPSVWLKFEACIALPFPYFWEHCWTVLTYMFVHINFWHILFNMLMLYAMGQIFIHFFSQKQLAALYVLGGMGGALAFLLAYWIGSILFNVYGVYYVVGASASIMAVLFALAYHVPNMEIRLWIIGSVKIRYFAFGLFALLFLFDGVLNPNHNWGGQIAHLGGAVTGYYFALMYAKGKDITAPFNRFVDWLVSLFKPRAKFKVKYGRPESDYDYNRRKADENVAIDRILDKIKKSGYSSLNNKEKEQLFHASQKQ